MPSSHRRRPAPPSAARAPGTASLRVQLKPERLTALLHAHHRLLDKIKQKRRELLRLETRVQETMSAASSRLQPVISEIAQRDDELHALFAELLGRKPQSRSTLTAIKDLYRTLQQNGMMSPQQPAAPAPKNTPQGTNAKEATESPPPEEEAGFSARRPSDVAANQSLRALFRRLAEALHPDKVQQEEEKLRLTEAMKDVTRAYQDGDIARLLELERSWLHGNALAAPSDELDRRCAALVATNEALRVQLDELMEELKSLRRSPQAALLQDLAITAQVRGQDPISVMVTDAQKELALLHELLELVSAFRDGDISLERLLRGPRSVRPRDAEAVDTRLDELFDETSGQATRRGKRRQRSANSHNRF